MMKRRALYSLIPFAFLAGPPVLGNDALVSCAQKSVMASAVRTSEDVQAFVQCAYEFVQEVGFEEARRAFNEDERWKSGSTYLFVAEVAPLDQARLFVFPPDPRHGPEHRGTVGTPERGRLGPPSGQELRQPHLLRVRGGQEPFDLGARPQARIAITPSRSEIAPDPKKRGIDGH